MLIYRFRVTSDELDSFYREIEIQPNQTFLDFHVIMMEAVDLHHCDHASFFMTDKRYQKDKEVSLKPEKRVVRKYDEDLDQVTTETISVPLMKDANLKITSRTRINGCSMNLQVTNTTPSSSNFLKSFRPTT